MSALASKLAAMRERLAAKFATLEQKLLAKVGTDTPESTETKKENEQ